uniref:Uncharacterized protein n=1 Tax=Salix viminalis TaxID=40686 RepID=A0A6N2MKC8_SALVM
MLFTLHLPIEKAQRVSKSQKLDIAALVLSMGEVYTAPQQKKQCVFVIDTAISTSDSELIHGEKLQMEIRRMDKFVSASHFLRFLLTGTPHLLSLRVGFYNLIKRANDQLNHLWMPEATENLTYSLSFDSSIFSHLKNAASSTQSWPRSLPWRPI